MKKSLKILSVFLAVLTFFSILSAATPVFAEDVNEYIADKEYTEKLLTEVVENDTEEKAPIVKEVEEKRDEYQKVYLREDGTYTAVISKTPVHYEKDGEWVDIVNDLKTNGDVITNTAGNFNVEFPKEISEGNEIKIENGKETITFSIVETEKSNGKVKNNKKQKQDKNKVSDEEIFNNDISRTVSEIEYEDVLENTNLEYVVTPTGVKENIIVENKESLKKSYSFNITKGKLQVELDKENNLYFKNSKGEVVFTIPAPVMTDSNGAISYDIDVKVKNLKKETITLTYTPDKKWLNEKDRAYPVAIDPVILLESNREFIVQDTVIAIDTLDNEKATKNGSDDFLGAIAYQEELDDNNVLQTNKYDVLVRLNMDAFSAFKQPNIVVTDVNYIAAGNAMNGNILAKPILFVDEGAETISWDNETITGADVYPELAGSNQEAKIVYEDTILDYFSGVEAQSDLEADAIYVNITDIFNEWLYGERENHGFALTAQDKGLASLLILGGKYTSSKGKTTYYSTYCTVDYVDANGFNSNFEYVSQEIGRAGTFNINTFTRGLSAYREDLSLPGNIMPVTVGFNYNSALISYLEWYTKYAMVCDEEYYYIYSPYGENWIPSNLHMLFSLNENQINYFTENGSVAVFDIKKETVVEKDDSGNEYEKTYVTFLENNNGESGYKLDLITAGDNTDFTNMILTTPTGEKEFFNDTGLAVKIQEATINSDGKYDDIEIYYCEDAELDDGNAFLIPVIDYIVDGVDRVYDFKYDESYKLTQIRCLSSLEGSPIEIGGADIAVTYNIQHTVDAESYEPEQLISVKYPDNKSIFYTYIDATDDNGILEDFDYILKNAKNIDGYNIEYTYDELNKVTKIKEYANTSQSVEGNYITLESNSANSTTISDSYNGTNTFLFSSKGELLYTFDNKGNYNKVDLDDDNVFEEYGWQISSQNLLENSSFELNDFINIGNSSTTMKWTNMFTRVQDLDAHSGYYVYCLSSEDTTSRKAQQRIPVLGGKNYTFSAYVNCIEEGEIYLELTATGASNATKTEKLVINGTADWEQFSLNISTDFEIKELIVKFGFDNTNGKYYIDSTQLEAGSGIAEYNYIQNGSFTNLLTHWTGSNISVVDDTINGNSVKALKIQETLPYFDVESEEKAVFNDTLSSTTQLVKLKGEKGDIYSIGAWFKGYLTDGSLNKSVKDSLESQYEPLATRIAQIKINYTYTNTTENGTVTMGNEEFAVDFLHRISDWQYINECFELKGDVTAIYITISTQSIPKDVLITGIELTKNNNAFVKTNETTSTTPVSTGCECTTCKKEVCSCECTNVSSCTCVECRSSETETKDIKGNILSNKSSNGINYISSLSTYTSDGNYLKSYTDENGNTINYDFNTLNGVLDAISEPIGSSDKTSITEYTYDAAGNVTKVLSKATAYGSSSTLEQGVQYSYTNDRLTQITTSKEKYTIKYDSWGQVSSVGITLPTSKYIPLVDYTYNQGKNREQIKTVTYTNSNSNVNTYTYEYTDSGELKTIYLNGTPKHILSFDNLGELSEVKNSNGRLVKYTENGTIIYIPIKDTSGNITGYKPVYRSITGDDKSVEENYGVTFNFYDTVESYDAKTGISETTDRMNIGKTWEKEEINTTDWFDRTISSLSRIIKIDSDDYVHFGTLKSEYKYKTESDGKTSSVVEEFINKVYNGDGDSEDDVTIHDGYAYEYDKQNRIISERSFDKNDNYSDNYSYEYDELGQLVRFNDNINQKTYVYNYDSNGNITAKKEYNYTTSSTLGTCLKTYTFTYESSWGDRLKSYDSQNIEYDNIGNPTDYMGAKLTWQGRELTSYSKDSYVITYEYDENGLRYKKTIKDTEAGSEITENYIWDNGKLVSLVLTNTDGESLTYKYLYNKSDEPIGYLMFESDGTLYADCYYLKNLQGDITGITTASGSVIVRYCYDAFGNRTTDYGTTNTLQILMKKVYILGNPFGYRGYCYDADSGLYYLQSRYYDPDTGRFINADNTNYLNATGTVLSCNLFAYCENDPVNNTDPGGNFARAGLYMASNFYKLINVLPLLITYVKTSLYSLKTAIYASAVPAICIAAILVAVVGIVYAYKLIYHLTKIASQAISAVKAKVKAGGLNPKKLSGYTVYVIVKKNTIDVVYVGITCRYQKRKSQHSKRFPPDKYTMLPIATGLTRNQARALEQTLITAYGLDTLKNMINSISVKKLPYFKSEFAQMQSLIDSYFDPE